MAKYLIEASYTAEGLRGLAKDKASGRQAAVSKAIAAVGGKLDAIYFAFGDKDAYVLCDIPDNVSAAALSMAVSGTGLARTTTIPLLTVDEVDQALSKAITYKGPGA